MLKSFLLIVSALILISLTSVLALEGRSQEAAPAPDTTASDARNPVKANSESLARAKKLYAIDCAMCHGDNGDGQTDLAKGMQLKIADWSDSTALAGKQDGELFKIIRNGKGSMPAEAEGRAKKDEVWGLILYIRTFSKGKAAPVAAPAAVPATAPATN